jgi:ribosomal protein S18 acetylase RimI-like enzyme
VTAVPPQQPAPLPAAEVVLTFLESVGRRSEAELYLRLFQQLPKESFAIIAPGGPVVRHALDSLVEQLRFLSDLGLFAPVVLGLFNPEAAASASERLVRRLPTVGLAARSHEVTEPEVSQRLRDELRAEQIPVLHFRPQEGVGFPERLSFLAELVGALDTRKVVFLRRRGGLVSKTLAPMAFPPGHELPTRDGRISVINLRTDRGVILRHLGKREVELVDAANSLVQAREPKSLLVSVTSPLNLLKELFTVKGAGTLIKLGTEIERVDDYSRIDVAKLSSLLESSFQRTLTPDFFSRPPLALYLEAGYRGAALVIDQGPAPYLSKFAVEPEAQGEGIGNDLWQAMLRDFPRIYWRSRPENPIHLWYQGVCDGMVRRTNWNVYWRGIDPAQLPELIACAESLPSDFTTEPI